MLRRRLQSSQGLIALVSRQSILALQSVASNGFEQRSLQPEFPSFQSSFHSSAAHLKKSKTEQDADAETKRTRNAAFQDFKRSIVRRHPAAAAAAMEAYHLSGGVPARHMTHSLMDLYSRRGDADNVIILLNELITNGPAPNEYSFGYAISALKKAAALGKRPPHESATRALALFNKLVELGLKPNCTIYNELIDCFGKAGNVDKAFELYQQSLEDGIVPTPFTFSILIKACAVADQLERALDVAFKMMPARGIKPGVAAWNGLLGAAAARGSVDQSYEIWQKMIKSGTLPDQFTERALATAFGSHPQLAAELVSEARELARAGREQRKKKGNDDAMGADSAASSPSPESSAAVGDTSSDCLRYNQASASVVVEGETQSSPLTSPSKQLPIYLDDLRRRKRKLSSAQSLGLTPELSLGSNLDSIAEESRNIDGGGLDENAAASKETTLANFSSKNAQDRQTRIQNLFVLDLHGHSQAAAQMALMRRLEALVESWPDLREEYGNVLDNTIQNNAISIDRQGLIIITGVGKGSREGVGVLRDAMHAVLTAQGLNAEVVAHNAGRLFIPQGQILEFSRSQWERMQREHVFAAARARYLTVGALMAGLMAAAVIIPRLAPWLI